MLITVIEKPVVPTGGQASDEHSTVTDGGTIDEVVEVVVLINDGVPLLWIDVDELVAIDGSKHSWPKECCCEHISLLGCCKP